jgi:lipoate-protein ligase A
LATPAENLALDEALLDGAEDAAETGGEPRETLRLWEPQAPFVVIGRSSRIADEVDLAACRRRGVPVLRRVSGGATIVTGPGCLMYSLVLSYSRRPSLRMIDEAHCFVLTRMADALRHLCPGVNPAGTSDLVIDGRKFSGNSMRCRREYLLYHGTLLYDFPLTLISQLLKTPPRQPAYRAERKHADFVTNFPATAGQLRDAICRVWKATAAKKEDWPRKRVDRLVAEKYRLPAWNE